MNKIIVFVGGIVWLMTNRYIVHHTPYIDRYQVVSIDTGGLLYALSLEQAGMYMHTCHEDNRLCTYMPLQQLFADWQWIRTIQYLGKGLFADYQEGVADLFAMTTDLSPYWTSIYTISQYIIPLPKYHETLDTHIVQQSWRDAVALGEKAIFFMCDTQRVDEIAQYTEQQFLDAYSRVAVDGYVCDDAQIPHSLAFTYFYYLQNVQKSSLYYRVAALSRNATPISAIMPAIVLGRVGYHRQSAQMRYEKFLSLSQRIDTSLTQESIIQQEQAQHALYKAVFELTLHIIQTADQQQDSIYCIQSVGCLQSQGLIQDTIRSLSEACGYMRGGMIPDPEQVAGVDGIVCLILDYALQEKFITTTGDLVYPLDPDRYIYGRRPDADQRWIIPRE